jgi:hypothetical protein
MANIFLIVEGPTEEEFYKKQVQAEYVPLKNTSQTGFSNGQAILALVSLGDCAQRFTNPLKFL